jgi:Tol biopolymer transport system component
MGKYYRTTFDSDNYSTAHPILSPDEKTLYFVSDMPGTIGLSDLFKTQINDDGTFGTPVNLGNSINTEGRDISICK